MNSRPISAVSIPTLLFLCCPVYAQELEQIPDCGLYTYRAEVVRVYDGDTIWANIDLGFNVVLNNEPLRLHRIDAPEVRGEGKERGKEVRDDLAAKIGNQEIFICTIQREDGDEKKGSFHRYLAEVWKDGENINDWLLSSGRAVFDDGK